MSHQELEMLPFAELKKEMLKHGLQPVNSRARCMDLLFYLDANAHDTIGPNGSGSTEASGSDVSLTHVEGLIAEVASLKESLHGMAEQWKLLLAVNMSNQAANIFTQGVNRITSDSQQNLSGSTGQETPQWPVAHQHQLPSSTHVHLCKISQEASF